MIDYGCGCVPTTTTYETPCLVHYYPDRDTSKLYVAFKDKKELIKGCLETDPGLRSIDGKIYRRGRDLMVKVETERAVAYFRTATMIVDQYNHLAEFDSINSATDFTIPGLTYVELQELAVIMTGEPFVPPVPPAPSAPDPEQDPVDPPAPTPAPPPGGITVDPKDPFDPILDEIN